MKHFISLAGCVSFAMLVSKDLAATASSNTMVNINDTVTDIIMAMSKNLGDSVIASALVGNSTLGDEVFVGLMKDQVMNCATMHAQFEMAHQDLGDAECQLVVMAFDSAISAKDKFFQQARSKASSTPPADKQMIKAAVVSVRNACQQVTSDLEMYCPQQFANVASTWKQYMQLYNRTLSAESS